MSTFTASQVEKRILLVARRVNLKSLLALRERLNLSVSMFAEAIRSLEQKGLLTRSGTQFQLTPQVSEYLRHSVGGRSDDEYFQSVLAPQLRVTELYLPNRERFLTSLMKSR